MAYKSKKQTNNKFNAKQNYSRFWMDNSYYGGEKFAGLGTASASSDIVKLIKLNSYRKAIANFVSILTKKNIPVTFDGNTSYTDGKSVTITTDIKDNNFDVTVGLALHEASHILLTDFSYLTEVDNSNKYDWSDWNTWKDLLNWIEDRRIDQYIFSTSPGYKAYYHKMYDYYWNDNNITTGLKSSSYRDPKDINSWMFRIVNSLNPAADKNALPDLDTILDLIDVANIKRLGSVREVGEIADKILTIIKSHLDSPIANQPQQSPSGQGESGEEGEDSGEGDSQDLTPAEEAAIRKALNKQREFLSGKTGKKNTNKTLQRKLDVMAKNDNIEAQAVGEGKFRSTCIVYDLTGSEEVARFSDVRMRRAEMHKQKDFSSTIAQEWDAIRESFPESFTSTVASNKEYSDAIQKGFDMGSLLGKKLQIRNESRDLVYNRMRSGHIDNRRLSQAGYGVETIFKQIQTDCYKKANLHISLDGSGSMAGGRWVSTLQMAVAIARAATYVQNLSVQVSIRSSAASGRSHQPVLIMCYDSKVNSIKHLTGLLDGFRPNSFTPEGLCFEALLTRKALKASSSDMDSYFLNLSDGEPSGIQGYEGMPALLHTRKQVDKMVRELDMGILSFFIQEGERATETNPTYMHKFKRMYGKYSAIVASDEVAAIAKQMNQTFLQKAIK